MSIYIYIYIILNELIIHDFEMNFLFFFFFFFFLLPMYQCDKNNLHAVIRSILYYS